MPWSMPCHHFYSYDYTSVWRTVYSLQCTTELTVALAKNRICAETLAEQESTCKSDISLVSKQHQTKSVLPSSDQNGLEGNAPTDSLGSAIICSMDSCAWADVNSVKTRIKVLKNFILIDLILIF